MKTINFRENKIFSYDRLNKIAFGIFVIFLAALLVLFGVSYFFLRNSDIFIFKYLNIIISHITLQISGSSILGIFYTTLIGGIFFISVPLEVLFVKFIKAGHPLLIVLIPYFIGLIISFTVNYYIGFKLSGLSKKLVSPKKFYKLKGVLNKYGPWAILFFNATPLPAQLLTVILGVFRYNKTRFYVLFLIGQFVKYMAISVFYYFF